ncbi:type II toxin-antitoxin system VapC family toxin [Leucobacter viscericola]|uniref:Ribonuclease VapC n=1 Tax=Leucobacter viscericola TaxID=2714935 RepID=A0A6G7XF49_9MICO|nr:PIN domain-containing protein [Leucobacter viscericola]QIK63069.1 type II toxin-antitoxin system VapC family toxin [Leucobacter viscericola]
MLRYLLDTDVAIALLRRQKGIDLDRFFANSGRLAISTISIEELEFGAYRSAFPERNLKANDELLAQLKIQDFNRYAAAHAAEVRATLAVRGTPIGSYDSQIAGHARSLGLTVVTGNTREFERVPGLLVENWIGGE